MHSAMLRTALVEDLNRLACPGAQDQYRGQPDRAREALDRLRFIDTTELDRYRREGWLAPEEADRIERFTSFARARLRPVPQGVDPLAFTHGDPDWQSTRESALELVTALDAFIDLGIPGWGRPHRAGSER